MLQFLKGARTALWVENHDPVPTLSGMQIEVPREVEVSKCKTQVKSKDGKKEQHGNV